MSLPEPTLFADRWISAWNARDVEAVLEHYAEDVVFTSPALDDAATIGHDPRGDTSG